MDQQLMSHYYCLASDPSLIKWFMAMDFAFWASYTLISSTMIWISWRTKTQKNVLFVMFWAFIFFCGQTHLFEILHYKRFSPEIDSRLYYLDKWLAHMPGAIVSLTAAMTLFGMRFRLRDIVRGMDSWMN